MKQGDCIDAVQDDEGCIDEFGAQVLDDNDEPVSDDEDWVAEDDDFRIGGGLQEGGKVEVVAPRVTSSLVRGQ